MDHEKPALRQIQGCQPIARSLGPGRPALHENRYVCAQAGAEPGQCVPAHPRVPQVIESHQGRGRVRAAAPEPPARGNMLVNANIDAFLDARLGLEEPGGPDHQVVFLGQAVETLRAANIRVRPE